MNKSKELFERLSPQEQTVLYLTSAIYGVLRYAHAEYVSVKVDVAFASHEGITVFSRRQGYEVSRYRITPDGTPVLFSSPEEETPEEGPSPDISKEAVNRIFRRWEDDETEGCPRTMLSNVELIGQFRSGVRAYAVAIGYNDGIANKEVFQYLFRSMIRSTHTKVVKKHLKPAGENEAPDINTAAITRDAAIRLLSSRFYGSEKDPRKEGLYETLCLLSSSPYEKAENRGRLGIATPTVMKSDALVQFTHPIDLKKENVRVIRKLLELSDRQNTILMADQGRIVGVYSVPDSKGKYSGTGVIFRGYGKWDLFSDKNGSIVAFDSVTVSLTNQSLRRRVREGFEAAGIMDYDEERILEILNQAKRQAHGTTIIVTDHAKSESTRLEKANRAIGIHPIEADERTILSLSAIDGAMIIDPSGICYAIGAILDGATSRTGNIARGARYNSAITYVDYWAIAKRKDKIKAVAIIVSSDDTVDIYPNQDQ